jgi:hypothetical protein
MTTSIGTIYLGFPDYVNETVDELIAPMELSGTFSGKLPNNG